jgi:hypothetical protein
VVTKGFGRYNEYPCKELSKNIGFMAGCIVEEKDSLLLQNISTDFSISRLPKTSYIVTDFPLKGKLSVLFGMKKVYPKLEKFSLKNRYNLILPSTEIYDRENKRIHYRFGFDKTSE